MPPSIFVRPPMMLSKVVLPQPEGPKIHVISPS